MAVTSPFPAISKEASATRRLPSCPPATAAVKSTSDALGISEKILRNMFGGFDNNVYLCNILNYKYRNAYENDQAICSTVCCCYVGTGS